MTADERTWGPPAEPVARPSNAGGRVADYPVIAVYHEQPESYLPLLFDTVPAERLRVCVDADGLPHAASEAEILLAFKFSGRPFPRDTILGLPRLAWVQLASAGSDHMLPFDRSRLTVTSASGIHGDTMAEYVIGTLLHLSWDFPRLLRQQRERSWRSYEVLSLAGRTMVVVGAGHVGGRIGARARAFGMRTIGVRRTAGAAEGFDRTIGPEGLLAALAEADVVVIALPLTAVTKGAFGRAAFDAMRRGAIFVNVSRGGIVDESVLLERLRGGQLAGAVLDVFATEPLPFESSFWGAPNVLVTPHIASEFAGWPVAVAHLFRRNLERWLRGEPLLNVVDPALGY